MGGGFVNTVHLAVPSVATVPALPGSVMERRLVALVVEICSSSDSTDHGEVRLLAVHRGVRCLATCQFV